MVRRVALAVVVVAILIPSAVLAALRLATPSAALWVQLTSFVPWAVPLLVVGAVALAILWWPKRSDRTTIAVAAVLVGLLALHLTWLAPQWVGGAPRADPEAEAITVVVINARFGRADAVAVAERVRDEEAGILVVSEATPAFVEALTAAGISDRLPMFGGAAADGAGGTVVFSTDPVETIERVEMPFGTYVLRTQGQTMIAAHPRTPRDIDGWHTDHEALRVAAREHGVTLIAGDLNATVDHEPVRRLLDDGYRDAAELTNAGWAPTWPVDRDLPLPVVAIDHVLVTDEVAVVDHSTFEVGGTDHRGLVTTVAPAA
ncbi:endonuclease/exonuclease/phosphatase family protein [Nocardioides sp. GXZ039]|uniref:endonuclease/exonuclease/phosphatase family protein n=1 Tax=Nocardioides sp. GXZ039 TaxID=3136018 RepID=UPI0030F47E1D